MRREDDAMSQHIMVRQEDVPSGVEEGAATVAVVAAEAGAAEAASCKHERRAESQSKSEWCEAAAGTTEWEKGLRALACTWSTCWASTPLVAAEVPAMEAVVAVPVAGALATGVGLHVAHQHGFPWWKNWLGSHGVPSVAHGALTQYHLNFERVSRAVFGESNSSSFFFANGMSARRAATCFMK